MRTTTTPVPEISISQLEEVFATFNKVSSDLGTSYKELEARVAGLSKELAATHSARLKELTEKEQLVAKLSSLMAALPGGVIALDSNGIIMEENPVAVQILGKSFLGSSWQQAMENSDADGFILNGEVSFSDNRRISIISSPYGDEGENIILLTDISESYRLNALVNHEKRLTALGEMAARLAHQVRTPLSSAILYLSHLSSPSSSPTSNTKGKVDKDSGTRKKILERLRQIEKLVDGMLSYIRGGINEIEEFSLIELLKSVSDTTALNLTAAHGQMSLQHPQHQCLLLGNQEALFNALVNLIENSIQAKPNKLMLELYLRHEDGNYIITLTDNGPGIDDAIKEQIFDPFFSTRPTGTGLGLAVALSAVKAHCGEIYISDASNGGTVFQLYIPEDQSNTSEASGLWGAGSQQLFLASK